MSSSEVKTPHTYTCDNCKGVFDSGWTLEEANAEAERLFGVANASERSDMAQVCDDCFREMGGLA